MPAARARAQVIATVPSDFFVGTAKMPAGDYLISEQGGGNVIEIAGARNQQASFALTIAGSNHESLSQPELLFDKIGDTYFLERIVIDSDNVRELPLTPTMKAHAAEHVAVVLRPMTHVSWPPPTPSETTRSSLRPAAARRTRPEAPDR